MHNTGRRGVGFNAGWNIIGGVVPAILAILLPPILIKALTQEAYGLWAIILQVTAIAAAFGSVGQISVARFVAVANTRSGSNTSERYVSTALLLAAAACVLMVATMAVAGLNIGRLLPQTPESLRRAGGLSLLIVSIGASVSLPGGVVTGHFMGEQRAHIPNAIILLGRFAQGILIIVVAVWTSDLIAIAVAHMAGNLLIFGAQLSAQHRLSPHVRVRMSLASRLIAKDIWRFSAILLLWQVAALVINGIDLVVLGHIAFAAVPFFAVAATVSAILSGVVGSIYNAFLPIATRFNEAGDGDQMASFLSEGLRLGATFAFAIGIPLIHSNEPLLRLWVGGEYASRSSIITSILLAAFLARTSVMMYVIGAVASGKHGNAWLGPVLEAAANLGLSVVLGIWLGSTGVALGTLLSAGIGVVAWLTLDPLRSVVNGRSGWGIFTRALARPAVVLLPIGILGMAVPRDIRSTWGGLVAITIVMMILGWLVAFQKKDRAAILGRIKTGWRRLAGEGVDD